MTARWLKLPKSTNKHLKRYARLFGGKPDAEPGKIEGVRWITPKDMKKSARWIHRFHRRNGH